jgi:hypothetical protein
MIYNCSRFEYAIFTDVIKNVCIFQRYIFLSCKFGYKFDEVRKLLCARLALSLSCYWL